MRRGDRCLRCRLTLMKTITGINAPLGITAERQNVNMTNVSGEHANVILLKHTLRWFVRNGQNSQKEWVYLENKKYILNIYSKEDKHVIPTYSSQGWEGLKLHAFFKKVTVTRIPRTVYRHLAERLICFVESTLGLEKSSHFLQQLVVKETNKISLWGNTFFYPQREENKQNLIFLMLRSNTSIVLSSSPAILSAIGSLESLYSHK